MPQISIIMTCFNQEKYIAEAITSCLKQTYEDFELIIIDDKSTDNSVKIVKEYAKKDKRIKLIQLKKNTGSPIVPRNTGIKKAAGEYILPLDADDKIAPRCLEKMFNAIQKGIADVICCNVEYFGKKTGEMELKEPVPKNMYKCNCLVNCSMFRKSDCENLGYFDEDFVGGWEDWDFWLNFIDLGKSFYRIPETLFFYRIKKSGRNDIDKNASKKLYEKIYDKHYIGYSGLKIKNLISNLFKTRKYDTVISVGAACFVPDVLKQLKLRDFSGPFDWMFGSDVITRLNIIKNRFKNYFNYKDFEFVGENPDNGKLVYKNTRTNIVYNHDFPHGDFGDTFPAVAEKYKRRIKRVLTYMDKDIKILLVYSELGKTGNINEIKNIIKQINDKYAADIDLLYINHNKDIELSKFKNPRRIAKNMIYAEYHYEKFPDELGQASEICKKIIKKVAK